MAHDHAPNYADDPNICLTCEQEREAERLNESLVQFANDRDYTTADLQADPELRKRLTAELAQEAGISHMTPEQQEAWWNGK